MKKILLSLIVVALAQVVSFGQSFEGKIVYQNTYKSKLPQVSDEQFNTMMGNTQEFLIKGGNYKSVMNGQMIQWQLYILKDNKLYSKMAMSTSAYWNDAAFNQDELIKAEINKGSLEILGHKCDELVLTCKSGIQKFYFSPKFPLDAKLFENHKFGNWNEFISRAKAVPLKMIMDTPQFSIESVATEVTPQKLDDKTFELPADIKVEKNPYN